MKIKIKEILMEKNLKVKKIFDLIFKDDNDEEFIDINKMPFLLEHYI